MQYQRWIQLVLVFTIIYLAGAPALRAQDVPAIQSTAAWTEEATEPQPQPVVATAEEAAPREEAEEAAPREEAEVEKPPAEEPDRFQFFLTHATLLGVISSESGTLAMIRTHNGQENIFHVGDCLPDSDYCITTIEENRVVFQKQELPEGSTVETYTHALSL